MSITHTSLTGCGIAASALALLVACGQSSAPVSEAQPIEQRQPQAEPTLVQAANYTYTRTCDGSAAALLPDGRIVIGNDEDSVLRIYNLAGGAPAAEPDLREALKLVSKKGEADIEAAAVVGDRIYWVTSHGLNSSGELELDRYRFFATATDANGVAMPTVFRDDLLKDPKFPSVDNAKASEAKPGEGGWNIEAMAPGPNGSLLFGFRSPLTDTPSGSAMVVPLTNPAEFLAKGAPVFSAPIPLDLGGRGIRDMVLINGRYLLIAGEVSDGKRFDLYLWDGPAKGNPPRKLAADLSDLNPEALVDLGGGKILVLSDEGDTELPQYGDKKCKNKNVKAAERRFHGQVFSLAI